MTNEPLDPRIIGEAIMEIRRRKGISQGDISNATDIGRTHISAIECGRRKPTMETLYKIACALGVPMSDILREVELKMSHGCKFGA